jgi:hypothetical protein
MLGPELGGAFVGVAGALPVRVTTLAKVVWDVVPEGDNPNAESAYGIDMSSAKMMMTRNGVMNKQRPSDLLLRCAHTCHGPSSS